MKATVLKFDTPKSSRLYYIDKKTNRKKRITDNIHRDLQCILRATDRTKNIPLKVRNLLINLVEMILRSPHKEIFVDHKFLSQLTEVKSSKQNANLLAQINDILDSTYHNAINFHGKRRTYGYVVKFTEDGYERAKNPVAFYTNQVKKNVVSDGKKFSPESKKISTSYISNKENPIEEISSSYARELISKKEKIYKKEKATEQNHTNCSNAILAEHSQFAPSVDDRNITTKQQPIENLNDTSIATKESFPVTEIPPMDQQEDTQPDKPQEVSYAEQLVNDFLKKSSLTFPQGTVGINDNNSEQESDKQTRKMLLSKALCSAFGEQVACDIQDNCKFEEISPHKVTIKPKVNITFNDIDKAKIRKCIKSVYGEDVLLALVNTTPYVSKEPVASESVLARSEVLGTPSQNNSQWLRFKGSVRDRKVYEMLANSTMKIIEVQDKVIIEGHAFLIEELFSSGCVEELEDAVVETGLTLEFHEKIVSRSYVTSDAKPIILTKEKIMKDREWRKTATDGLDNFINEFKKKRSCYYVNAKKNLLIEA